MHADRAALGTHRPRRVALPPSARETVYGIAFGRIEAAVASSCGSQHAVNEDAHSPLGGIRPALRRRRRRRRRRDGADREPPARRPAARGARRRSRSTPSAVRGAMLGADRAIASRIARVTARPGAATVVLCAPIDVLASRWLVAWVGDCRVYRWSGRGELRFELLTRDDTFRHLGEAPPPGGSPHDPARMVGNGATTGANVGDPRARPRRAARPLQRRRPQAPRRRRTGAGCSTQPVPLAQRCDALVALARAQRQRRRRDRAAAAAHRLRRARPRWLRSRRRPPRSGRSER